MNNVLKNKLGSSSGRGRGALIGAIAGVTTSAAVAACYVAYDYKTCHPMRQVKGYDPEGAFIRFHNMLVRYHLFPTVHGTMSLQQLAQYDGHHQTFPFTQQPKIYFSSDGYVYDATKSEMFYAGHAYSQWAGKDATVALAIMSMSPSDINRQDWNQVLAQKDAKGSLTNLNSLKSWTYYFGEKYYIVGRLKEYIE